MRNGPPDAVSWILFSPLTPPCKHWNIALCSESTGIISAPESLAALISRLPASTNDSLLASMTLLPELTAANTEAMPALPTIAAIT